MRIWEGCVSDSYYFHDHHFPTKPIVIITAAMIMPTMPNIRTCRLQSLQTAEGHHGIFIMKRKPMFANQPTSPRSSSDFSFPQLRQVNMAKPSVQPSA